MKKIFKLFSLSKRRKFVAAVIILSAGVFFSEYLSGIWFFTLAFFLSLLTVAFLYSALRKDINNTFFYPIFILPLLFTLAFSLFYILVPPRLISRIILTSVYAFGLYSLFLTQNIFAVSTIRTINLVRSARIVSFIITIVVLFLLTNVIFSIRLPIYISPFIIFLLVFLLNFQSLWIYSLNKAFVKEGITMSLLISLAISQLSLVLALWPVNAAIYSIFLTGIFYAYSGLCHAWIERRLFKNVLWEYIWVGVLAILILVFFSEWGI